MSSYEPPPLDSPSVQNTGNRRPRGPKYADRGMPHHGAPLLNPFGSPMLSGPDSKEQPPVNFNAKRQSENRPIVAFISGIAEGVSDIWVEKLLKTCGDINSWRRVCSADGNPQGFGFCEFKSPNDAASAIRVLSSTDGRKEGGWSLPSIKPTQQKLMIQVDFSVKELIDECQEMTNPAASAKCATDDELVQSVEGIIRELEAAVIETSQTDETKDEGGAKNDDGADNTNEHAAVNAESGDDDGEKVVSLELEEEWEKERARSKRHKRYIAAAEEREQQTIAKQNERGDRIKWNAMRDLDEAEEKQHQRDDMSVMLSKWDDVQQAQMGEHSYYRDRQRWWRHRKAERAREMELDDADRRQQEREACASEKPASATTERRDLIEALIKEIPSDPKALFEWPVKWEQVNDALIKSKIEPAVRKRLAEYLGGEGDDSSVSELSDYVVTHIREHKPPQELIDELEMVLVEEAPTFVARIWRFVVYESEAHARNVT
ncbi:hypothetical protein GGH19_001560 [Coemansia sp. RSA 1807]|nr:hypothetical protein J3F82_000019 [Coemansia sp. RSA 637]KAJ2577167.1 hypothetical protein GGH19_001560 [Coemansia sp. RSA 1807]